MNEELLELIDVPHLSALALAHWFNDTYDDVLEERPAPKIKRASAKRASRSAKKKRDEPRSGTATELVGHALGGDPSRSTLTSARGPSASTA